jgi:hypothetical protein
MRSRRHAFVHACFRNACFRNECSRERSAVDDEALPSATHAHRSAAAPDAARARAQAVAGASRSDARRWHGCCSDPGVARRIGGPFPPRDRTPLMTHAQQPSNGHRHPGQDRHDDTPPDHALGHALGHGLNNHPNHRDPSDQDEEE